MEHNGVTVSMNAHQILGSEVVRVGFEEEKVEEVEDESEMEWESGNEIGATTAGAGAEEGGHEGFMSWSNRRAREEAERVKQQGEPPHPMSNNLDRRADLRDSEETYVAVRIGLTQPRAAPGNSVAVPGLSHPWR